MSAPIQGPPLHFAVQVGSWYLRHVHHADGREQRLAATLLNPEPRWPVVAAAIAKANGWLR